jgi:hypothetical protein
MRFVMQDYTGALTAPTTEIPSSVPIHLNVIPGELREIPQWVGWIWKQDEKQKWTKLPINPKTGFSASSTDPSTWSSFDEALESLQREELAGVGFVITENDLFVGIDLDDCRDPQTGTIDSWAQEIIDRVASYSEVTPSGTGVRIWITTQDGLLPEGEKGRRKGPIEVYAANRFFTVTGQSVCDGKGIVDRTEELETFYSETFPPKVVKLRSHVVSPPLTDDEVILNICGTPYFDKFLRLMGGDLSDYEGDHSRADLALLGMLAFYTQDPDQLDRLFRKSKLYRQKWERDDYRLRTINQALEREEVYLGDASFEQSEEPETDAESGPSDEGQPEDPETQAETNAEEDPPENAGTQTENGSSEQEQSEEPEANAESGSSDDGQSEEPETQEEAPESGNALLDDLRALLSRYVCYPSLHALIAHVLWIAQTHAMDAWDSTPRLAVQSSEPASGKTRALELTGLLVPRPIETTNVSAAYLFRKVSDPDGRPTLLMDEADTLFGPKAKDHEDIRGLLNAGHRKGAVTGRCTMQGKMVVTEEFPAYCAVALAGLGQLPDTVQSRSVVLRMRRRAPHETVEPFRRRQAEKIALPLRERLEAWGKTLAKRDQDAWPEMPPGVEDRDADVWEPLIAVADEAGGEWPSLARSAAMALVAESKESSPSLGIRLLFDLRTIFKGKEGMPTADILKALIELDESPWGEMYGGKPLNSRGLAKRLAAYGVKPKMIRFGATTARGYARSDLIDAWTRYLPPVTDDVTEHVTDEGGKPPHSDADVADVTDVTSISGEAEGQVSDTPNLSERGFSNLSKSIITKEEKECDPCGPSDSLPPSPGKSVTSVTGVTSSRVCLEPKCTNPLPSDHVGFYCVQHGGSKPSRFDELMAQAEIEGRKSMEWLKQDLREEAAQ